MIVELISTDPSDTRLNCTNLSNISEEESILCLANAHELFTTKFQIMASSAPRTAAKKGWKRIISAKNSKDMALMIYPINPVIAYFIKGE
jgi:hypothetical protein